MVRASDSSKELHGLCAVVTGSSRGIGRAIALALAKSGANLVIHCHRSIKAAKDVSRLAQSFGVSASVIAADLSNEKESIRFIDAAWNKLGAIDIWVNNAGADILTGENIKLSYDQKLKRLLELDVIATIKISRDVGARMKNRGSGHILNMGWDQAEMGMEGDSGELYAASKAAIMAFTKSLSLSLAPGVRVNCLAPGWIKTAWGDQASETWQEKILKEVPLNRWGCPEDVAAVAKFLVAPSSSFITGQTIRINGGAVRI